MDDEPMDLGERRLVDPRSIPRVRFSTLKELAKSPLHYLERCQRRDETESLSRRLGSGVHAVLFDQPIAIFGPGTYKGKEYKGSKSGAYWDAFQLEHADATILSVSEHAESVAMAAAIRQHPISGPLLFRPGTLHEWEVLWTYCGRAMASHLDAYRFVMTEGPGNRPVLIELKTARDGNPDRFGWAALRYHYFAQLACYTEAVESLGHPTPEPLVVLVESSRPYAVSVLRVAEEAIEFGRRQLRGWMEDLLRCEAAGEWPGYSQTVETLTLPIGRHGEDDDGDE